MDMAHITDTVGCAIEAQETIAQVRRDLSMSMRLALTKIAAATCRGCGVGSEMQLDDIERLLVVFDEDLTDTLGRSMRDLRDRAGGED